MGDVVFCDVVARGRAVSFVRADDAYAVRAIRSGGERGVLTLVRIVSPVTL